MLENIKLCSCNDDVLRKIFCDQVIQEYKVNTKNLLAQES